MASLLGVIDYYTSPSRFSKTNYVEFVTYTIDKGKTVAPLGNVFRLVRAGSVGSFTYSIQVPDFSPGTWRMVLDNDDWNQMVERVDRMETHNHYTENTYRNAKENLLFKQMYNIKKRDLKFERFNDMLDAFEEFTQNVESFACVECGVLLPIGSLQVDHQRPKAQDRYEALVKALRTFGFTEAGPKGQKGKILGSLTKFQVFTNDMSGRKPIKARFGGTRPDDGSTLEKRYTLNNPGIALVSMAHQKGDLDQIKTNYIHSIYNLRPMCAGCNVARNAGPQSKFA